MIEIGKTLREARTRQGLSIHDAEDATKIRTRYLQALEQEDFEIIPGSTFVMGFLRTYATYLGLDADSLVDEYRNRFDPRFLDPHKLPTGTRTRSRPSRPASRSSNYVLVAIIALVLILLLAWIGWGNRRGSSATMETPVSTTSTTASSSALPADASRSPSTQDATTAGTSEQAAAGTTTTRVASATGGLTVEVTAKNDRCYLIVRDGSATGKTLYSQTLNENETITFEAKAALWMNIANPSAIVMKINGTSHEVPEPYGIFKVTAAGLERL